MVLQAFKNVIVNGLVLAEDGKKMSKRLKNYPDPEIVISAHGADALRMYLINSPVVRGEELRFREQVYKPRTRTPNPELRTRTPNPDPEPRTPNPGTQSPRTQNRMGLREEV